MTKQEIFELFDRKIAKTVIHATGSETKVLGNFCELEYMGDGLWDLYLRNADSPVVPLSGRRISQFMEKFAGIDAELVKLDGEAWCQGKLENGLKERILAELKWLGIRKSPVRSASHIEALKKTQFRKR